MIGKWMVTMSRGECVNKAVANGESEQEAMDFSNKIHGHKGWLSVSAVPAVKMTQEEVERMFIEEQLRDEEYEAFLRITA